MKEFWVRLKYNVYCVLLKDDSWDMGVELVGDKWLDVESAEVYDTYADYLEGNPCGRVDI